MKTAWALMVCAALFISGCGAGGSSDAKVPEVTGDTSSPALVSGYLYPKYQIVEILYTAPGKNSSVTYPIGRNICGVSAINSRSFSSGVTVSTQSELTSNLMGSYAQSLDTAYPAAIGMAPSNYGMTLTTSTLSPLGVDHDDDIITIWLNPAIKFSITGPASVRWDGYEANPAGGPGMRLVWLYVSQLKDPSLIPPNVAAGLSRTWDTSGVGGLTADDYAAILAAHPFGSAPFNPNNDSTHRFDRQLVGSTDNEVYMFTNNGAQSSVTRTYTASPATPASIKNNAEYSYNVACSLQGNTEFTDFMTKNMKSAGTYTTTNVWNSLIDASTSSTSFTLAELHVADHYTGPTAFQVWRDNIYGSYLFYPVQ